VLKSKRLKPVTKIAKMREDDAALAFSEYRKVVDQNEAKLIELRGYHDEYRQRLTEAGLDGMNIARINGYRSFISRLAIAVKQQETQLFECQQILKEKNQAWLLTRSRHQALGKVVDRYQEQEYQESEKRAQTESDEHSQNMGRHKKTE